MLTNPNDYDIRYAAPYFHVLGERSGDTERYYTTWKELFDKSFRVVSPDTKPSLPAGDYGGSYAYIARAVLINAARNNVPGAEEAGPRSPRNQHAQPPHGPRPRPDLGIRTI